MVLAHPAFSSTRAGTVQQSWELKSSCLSTVLPPQPPAPTLLLRGYYCSVAQACLSLLVCLVRGMYHHASLTQLLVLTRVNQLTKLLESAISVACAQELQQLETESAAVGVLLMKAQAQ